MSHLKYRPELDGLRAVAVLAVLLFHADLGLHGGYVGVDVFFVISGFLITSLILREGPAFSLKGFWERRLRRIVPALSVMIAASVAVSWLVLFPADFARFGRSVVAQSLLLANVHFWRDSNYFAVGEVRPILHTWTLAVEEQFYVFFPLLMLLLKRAQRRTLVLTIAGIALTSFALSVYAVSRRPSAGFYLLPPRAWELALGALLAVVPDLRMRSQWGNEILSAIGLLAIAGACWFYDQATPFPGVAALLPCFGAAAIIFSNSPRKTWNGNALSLEPVVALGLVSYSLYLWHWPVLTLARYRFGASSRLESVGLLLASLFLAFLSWRWVESPVRQRRVLGRAAPLFAASFLAVTGALASGAWIAYADGAPQRFTPEVRQLAAQTTDSGFRIELGLDSVEKGELVALGKHDVQLPVELIVWGDSHAMAVLHVIDQLCREHQMRCLAATHSATPPLLNFSSGEEFSMGDQSEKYNSTVLAVIQRLRPGAVLLGAAWGGYDTQGPRWQAAVVKTIRALQTSVPNVLVLEDVPYPDFDVPITLANAAAKGRDLSGLGIPLEDHRVRNRYVNAIFRSLAGGAVSVLDPTPFFCNQAQFCRVASGGHALYFDHHHLSTYGAGQLKPLFEPYFQSLEMSRSRSSR